MCDQHGGSPDIWTPSGYCLCIPEYNLEKQPADFSQHQVVNKLLWYVALGSGMGGAARLLIGSFVQHRVGSSFPFGTLVINITGSFVLGFLIRYALGAPNMSPELRALMTTGFCGGYTTFSTYSFETATLIEDGRYERAAIYVLLSVGLALLGVFGGFATARHLLGVRATA
jgi:fluoride exporter